MITTLISTLSGLEAFETTRVVVFNLVQNMF
jgi:hypothetical protein